MSSKPGQKRGRGRPPGQPKTGGRKKGTPNRATNEVKSIAQQHGPEIIDELYRIATSSASDGDRIQAARTLLERGYGRPASPIHLSGPDGGPIDFMILVKSIHTQEHVDTIIKMLTGDQLLSLAERFVEIIAGGDPAEKARLMAQNDLVPGRTH
jgi:hypothetical protein